MGKIKIRTSDKRKKCRQCKALFAPTNSMHIVCSLGCAVDHAATDSSAKHYAKAYRKDTREKKEAIKTRADYLKEAQTAFNSYIRARDRDRACISCGAGPYHGQRHASHYRSVGACSALRFNTYNVHASCAQCNSVKSGNLIEYRIRLVRKLGSIRVEWLECQNDITRYDIDYLKRLKRVFSRRAKLINRRES